MPEALPVSHGAPHDLPKHVSAPFVRRHDPVGDEERHRAGVIGDYAHRHVGSRGRALVSDSRPVADRRQQWHEKIGVVVRQGVLQHRGDPLESHACVDRRRGQRLQHAIRLSVELHEDDVPDFDVAVAGALEPAACASSGLRVAGNVRPAEVVNLRAPAARPRVAHLPEVVSGSKLANAFGGEKSRPDVISLRVSRDTSLTFEHGGEEPIRGQPPLARSAAPMQSESHRS